MDPIQQVRKILYRRLRVKLIDGRVLLGDLQSYDKQGNLILGQTYESVVTTTGKTEERHMGVVLIPQQQRELVELQGTLEEKMMFTAL